MNRNSPYLLLLCLYSLFFLVHGQTDCIVCDSRINPACATLEDISSLSSRCESDQDCIVLIEENKYTVRGCPSNLLTPCEGTDLCVVCTGNNCNNRIYPAERQECHQCVGCETSSASPSRPCVDYQENDKCFVAVEDNAGILTTYRGCVSDSEETTAKQGCTKTDDLCLECEGSGCNSQPQSSPSTLSCIQCDSSDTNCADPQEEEAQLCTHQVVLGRTDQCYTYRLGEGGVQRGCLLDPSTPSQYKDDCSGNNGNCEICSTPGCNANHALEIIECIVCDESQDPDCRNLNNNHPTQVCPSGPYYATGCYRYESNNNVVRGCVSVLQGTPNLEECHVGEVCKICFTDGCNAKVDFQECYRCNSELDTDCLRVQNNTRPNLVCHDYMDTCVQMIEYDTRLTIRGCTSEVDPWHTPLPTMRQTCNDNFCNSGIYPSWRTSCHQCDSGDGCNRNSTETSEFIMPCKIFWQDDQCYSDLRNQQAVRGCMSDNDTNVEYCQASDICVTCIGAGCNFRPASRPATLSCIHCRDDPLCTWGFPVQTGEMCNQDVWMGQQEGCYTGVGPNGDVVRGCALSALPCPDDYSCDYCGSSSCNRRVIVRQQCVHCRSNAQGEESCAEEAEGLEPRECSCDYQSFETRGCYTMRKPNDIVIRGCSRDLSTEDFGKCLGPDYFCDMCFDQGCNVDPAPAKASIQQPVFFLILLVSFAIFKIL